MASNSEIDLIILRDAINRIFDHIINELDTATVHLGESLYWTLDPKYKYDMSNDPTKFEVGNLHDDWEILFRTHGIEGIPSVSELTEIAPLLQYIGETFDQFSKKNKK